MNHDPERLAADYLDGAMDAGRHRAFESHLISCESCWQEVRLARRGRRIAEQAREVAPPRCCGKASAPRSLLRTPVSRPDRHPGKRGRTGAFRRSGPRAGDGSRPGGSAGHQPPVATSPPGQLVATAVTDYATGRLPGSPALGRLVPDLAALGLRLDGGGIGRVAGRELVALDYRDPGGHRIAIYFTGSAIPAPWGAKRLAGPAMAWAATVAGVRVLCVNTALVVGRDPALVTAVAQALHLMS